MTILKGKIMDYIINNISKSLYSDDEDYSLYKVIETNHKKGYVIVENRNDNTRYKIVVKAIKE